jgi:hypothetical protein
VATKVLYICAPARSGTSILGRTLGSLDGFVWAGEVAYLWKEGMVRGTCTCGSTLEECELWSRVLEPGRRFDGVDAYQLARLQESTIPTRHSWRTVRRFLREPVPGPSTPAGHYARLLADLYRRIGAAAGGRVIVDSSKDPARAALLSRMPDLSLTVLHVVRDPRATVFSHITRAPRARPGGARPGRAAYTALAWRTQHRAADELREAIGPAGMLVRYEDYVQRPSEVLAEIPARVGVKVGSLPLDGDVVELRRAHAVVPPHFEVDPPLRPVALRSRDRWLQELHPLDRLLTTALTLPMLRRYGYLGT